MQPHSQLHDTPLPPSCLAAQRKGKVLTYSSMSAPSAVLQDLMGNCGAALGPAGAGRHVSGCRPVARTVTMLLLPAFTPLHQGCSRVISHVKCLCCCFSTEPPQNENTTFGTHSALYWTKNYVHCQGSLSLPPDTPNFPRNPHTCDSIVKAGQL